MAGAPRRERKVVTVLFCDLVGFTSRAESMDPEDVEALLRPYHERVRSELERHGGTVEKFIGDAVMALSVRRRRTRTIRAGRSGSARDPRVRPRGGARAEGGDHHRRGARLARCTPRCRRRHGVGDVVTTAARLQSAAPVNGVIVDETTYRATRSAIDYEEADPVEAKGKSEPIAVWEAVRARSRFGVDVAHEARSELVGRERELGIVQDVFEARATSGRRSSSRSWACPDLGRAASSTSSPGSSTPTRRSSRGVRAAASRTGTALDVGARVRS